MPEQKPVNPGGVPCSSVGPKDGQFNSLNSSFQTLPLNSPNQHHHHHLYMYSPSHADLLCKNLRADSSSSFYNEPNLHDLVETEVFVGEEERFFEDDQSHFNGVIPSTFVINYHKDTFLHPLNSVQEDVEAEEAEEVMSGNFHSLDYLGVSMGPSSLSSSVISSVSLDEAGLNSLNKYQNCGSCLSHPCPSRDLYTKSVAKVKSSHHPPTNGKVSPSYNRISPNSKSPPPNLVSKDENATRQNCCCKYLIGKQNNEKIKTNTERKMPVWHNPSKADKLNSSGKKENSSFFKKYGFCRAKSEVRETNNTSDNKFSSLPRKKKEKNEKDIVAETYGTLGRNRKKKEVEKPKIGSERHFRDLPHESKNILDKYATLPRKKAKEMSARWRELNSQKEAKDNEHQPRLQRSKSIGKETSKSVRTTPSPCLSSASSSAVNSPRNPSTSKPNTKLNLKITSPSARLLSKQNGTSKEKAEKSPSPRIYFSNRQPKLLKNKKNAQVQVNLTSVPDENSLEEKLLKLEEEYSILQTRLRTAEANSEEVEQMRMEAVDLRRQAENERLDKEELQLELEKTSGKVKEMLTSMEGVEKEFNNRGESLIELESQLHVSSDINIQMQEKINQYEEYNVKLKKDLDKSLAAQKILLQQVQDLEAEGREMVEFIAEEKNALSECLKEAELELCRQRKEIEDLKKKMQHKEEEATQMLRLAEDRRIGYLSLQTELESLQTSTEDIMVCQGAQVSGASVGLSNLSNRLQILTGKLIQDYSISDNDIENIVTPVESDSSVSSTTGTPDLPKSPIRSVNRNSSPRKPVSFMQSFLNAMRSAHSSSRLFLARAKNTEERGSPEGSEISASTKQYSEEVKSPCQQNLSDQVSEIDALLTRFLKVCCVLKSDADNILSELEDENERVCSQIQLQQQMIEHQYAEFESLSNLECNARKELKLITKDLEFANATLNKVCDDDTKMRVKNVDEALREINLNLGRMDTMHAEKKERMAQARHKLPYAQNRMHWGNCNESPKRKHYIQGSSSHSRTSLSSRHHWKELEDDKAENELLLNISCNETESLEKNEHFENVVNHVLKTLETVPDIVSTCPALKNLYLYLTSCEPLSQELKCNLGSLLLSRNGIEETPSKDSRHREKSDSSSSGEETLKESSSVNNSSSLYNSDPDTLTNSNSTNNTSTLKDKVDNHTSDDLENRINGNTVEINLGVDCNANPETPPDLLLQNDTFLSHSPEITKFIPRLPSETSL